VKSSEYRVKVTIGDATVEVEGKETGVVKIVEALTEVLRGSRRAAPVLPAPSGTVVSSVPSFREKTVDIRTFFEEKKPSSDVEATAVVAYYYQNLAPEAERQEFIDSAMLARAFRLARRPLPSRMIYTLTNARNAGYLDSKGDGQYKLNPVGYNLVEHVLGRPPEKTAGKVRRKGAKVRRRKRKKRA
jgi:hypothetical protein